MIDYGTHSVNVLCAMLRLREDNKDKVMLLCGNHETDQEGMSGKNIYKDDLLNVKTIFTLDKSNVIDEIFSKNISLIGPDMLALHFENEEEGTYFMHGMYPFVQINGMYYDYYDTNTTDTVNRFLETRGGKNASFVSELIQWNDLSGNPASKASERGIDGIVSVGSNDLISVMNKYKIKGFIRGHQDNCGAQYYPYHEDCHNTINIHHETDFFNKRQNKLCRQSSALHDNWCTQKKPIRYNWEILTDANKTNIKNRIITLSMAHEKHTDPRYKTRNSKTPPMGGYIKLTALLNEESKLRV